MNSGTQALINSRVPAISTGMQGSPFDDATHGLMVTNRNRIYESNPPIDPSIRTKHDVLFQEWLVFYFNPLNGGEMSAPEKAKQFRYAAMEWNDFLNKSSYTPATQPSNLSNVLLYGAGALTIAAIAVFAARK